MHPHHRRLVRKAGRAGIVVERNGTERLDGFAELYEQTMRRVRAEAVYFFADDYWACLAKSLGDRLVCMEATLDGRVLAAILCLASPPWLHYYLGASSDEGRTLGANHFLLYSAAAYGQHDGYEQFHLGSGLGGEGGSLLEFKRRFTPAPLLEQWFGKAVHDRERYLELAGGQIDYEGFFPAYRRS
jgi:lipid II:glycine glycyltransferase (peptidoglycan interpeptide bridge formation enzyme)